MLDALRAGPAAPRSGLAAMLAQALPGVDLAGWDARTGRATDITAELGRGRADPERVPLPGRGWAGSRPPVRSPPPSGPTPSRCSPARTSGRSTRPGGRRRRRSCCHPTCSSSPATGPVVNAYRVDGAARTGLAGGAAQPDRAAAGPDRRERAGGRRRPSRRPCRSCGTRCSPTSRRRHRRGCRHGRRGDVGAVPGRRAGRRVAADHPDPAGHRQRAVAAVGQAGRRAGAGASGGRLDHPRPDAFTSAWAWMGELAAGSRPPWRSCSRSATSTRPCW